MTQRSTHVFDKLTRNRIFISRYWKQQCFALNAQTIIDKVIEIKYIGGLYSGSKRPTKFLCLLFKMLQIGASKPIIIEYLKARQYKYLTALSLLYLRLTLKGAQVYQMLQPFYNDNRKLVMRDSIGQHTIIYIDQFVDKMLRDQNIFGITLPFLPKRQTLEEQGTIEVRVSLLEQQQQDDQKKQDDQNDQKQQV